MGAKFVDGIQPYLRLIYVKYMGGVNLADQRLLSHFHQHRPQTFFWRRAFDQKFAQAIRNAYLLFDKWRADLLEEGEPEIKERKAAAAAGPAAVAARITAKAAERAAAVAAVAAATAAGAAAAAGSGSGGAGGGRDEGGETTTPPPPPHLRWKSLWSARVCLKSSKQWSASSGTSGWVTSSRQGAKSATQSRGGGGFNTRLWLRRTTIRRQSQTVRVGVVVVA